MNLQKQQHKQSSKNLMFIFFVAACGFSFSACSVGSTITPPSLASDFDPSYSPTPDSAPEPVNGPVLVSPPVPVISETAPVDPVAPAPSPNSVPSNLNPPGSGPSANSPSSEDDPFKGETLPSVSMENPITEFDEMPPAPATQIVPANPHLEESAPDSPEGDDPQVPIASEPVSSPPTAAPQSVMDVVEGVTPDSLPEDITPPPPSISVVSNDQTEGIDPSSRSPASDESEDDSEPSFPEDPDESDSPVSTIPEDFDSESRDEDKEQEVVVKGSCMGKKRAAIFWHDRRDKKPKKKNRAVKCEKGSFRITFKAKKKHLKHFQVQTAFYD